MKAPVSILALILLLATVGPGNAAEKLRWLKWDQVPTYIYTGALRGRGTGDQMLERFIAALPDYDHQIVDVNMPRYHREIVKPNTCVALAWYTSLEAHLVRTRPHSLGPAAGVYMRRDHHHRFGAPGRVLSLKELIRNPDLHLGGLAQFYYSLKVDELLRRHGDQPNVTLLKPDEIAVSFRLLDYGRVDYFFGWYAQLVDLRANGGAADDYMFHPLEEAQEYVRYYAHCQDDARGRAVIAQLNELMDENFLTWVREEYALWVHQPKAYRQIFDQHIIKRQDHPLVTDREPADGPVSN